MSESSAPARAADRDLAPVAALIAEPARAAMLAALARGTALPAGELAARAGVHPATAVLEIPSIIVLAVSAALSPLGGVEFWLRLFAALAFAGVPATYWLRIHTVNKVWLSDAELTRASTAFFGASPADEQDAESWTKLRDRWERAHLIRAVLAGGGLIAAVAALA